MNIHYDSIWSTRERRFLFLNQQEAETVLEELGKAKTRVSAENSARDLHEAMFKRLKRMGFMTKLFHGGAARAEKQVADTFLDAAAQLEIETKTDAAYSWINHFVNRSKYRDYVALQAAVKERLRQEAVAYVQARQEKLNKLGYAAGVSAKLKSLKTVIPLATTDDALQRALGTVGMKMQKKREKQENAGNGIPAEWKEGAEKERILKQQLLRFGVVSLDRLDASLQDNADGGRTLVDAIRANPFQDPDDPPPQETHEAEKRLCLSIAKQLRDGFLFGGPYKGYRNYRITQRTGNELPLAQKLRNLGAEEDPVGKRVQMVLGSLGKVEAHVLSRSDQYPEALILAGAGVSCFVLDTKTKRISYLDGAVYRHEILKDTTFSILQE